jgi:hypothetical protein
MSKMGDIHSYSLTHYLQLYNGLLLANAGVVF